MDQPDGTTVWGAASHHAVLAERHRTHRMEQSGARALPARLSPPCVRSRIALFVRCLPPSLPRRKACLGRSFVQTAERDLSTLANGVFASARSDPPLSSLFANGGQNARFARSRRSLIGPPIGGARSSDARERTFRSRDRAIRPAVVVSLRERRPQCSLRSRPPFADRSSSRRRAIFRRSRTHIPLANGVFGRAIGDVG